MANDGSPLLVKTIYAFKGTNNDELNFKKGDLITVTQVVEGGWWEGTLDEVTGWFPSNYVKEYKPDQCSRKAVTSDASLPEYVVSRQESMKIYHNVVLKEMIESEKTHVGDLQNLLKVYLFPLQKAEILTNPEYRLLIGNFEEVVECHRKLLTQLEECSELPTKQQHVGGVFIQLAPQLKTLHTAYCANHPRAVTMLEKYRDELSGFMESHGASSPGIMVLTTGLSKAFRRLEKYPGLLQELERHMEESHADRGDTQRAIHVYREIAESCLAVRRQREMELEVMTGTIHGWEGEEIGTLGEIVSMSPVVICTEAHERKDRYLVLFPNTLIILSVSSRMSAFLYEGKLPLAGISVCAIDNSDVYHNAFEITGSLIERMVVVCTSPEEQDRWVKLLRQHIRSSRSSTPAKMQPPHTPFSSSTSSLTSRLDAKLHPSPSKSPSHVTNRVWTMSCLRPSPPLRPCLALGVKEEASLRRNSSRTPRKKGDRSHDDDAQILRVIEAYCTGAKTRYTVNSALLDSPQVLIAEEEKIIIEESSGCQTLVEEKSLVDTVYALKDHVKELKKETVALAKNLEDERRARQRLEDIVRKHVLAERDDIKWDEAI